MSGKDENVTFARSESSPRALKQWTLDNYAWNVIEKKVKSM